MFSTLMLKSIHLMLAVALLFQPILAAAPIPVAHAAAPGPRVGGEPAPSVAAGPTYPAAPSGRLVATAPAERVPMATQAQVEETLRTSPIMFIESDSKPEVSAQGKERLKKTFQVQGAGGSMWLAPDAVWVTLLKPPAEETMEERLMHGPEDAQAAQARAEELVEGVNLKISFDGANPNPHIEGFDPLDTKVSFFKGGDPGEWRIDVPVWGGVRYTNLYPGIDLVVGSKDGAWDWKLEVKEDGGLDSGIDPAYDFFSFDSFLTDPTPGPSPLDAVSLHIEGAKGLNVLSSGKFALQPAVEITTNVGEYTLPLLDVVGAEPDPAIVADAVGEVVEAPFADAAVPKWVVRAYQAETDDLVYSTYLGGENYEWSFGVAADTSGAAYVTGTTDSTNFPSTPGAFRTPLGDFDAFVAKISADGRALVYSTYFGGGYWDEGTDIAVDASGAAYIIGQTEGNGFPLWHPIQSYAGDYDAFVTKLSPDGSALVYSTYLGGSDYEQGDFMGITVDSAGSAYVTGGTYSDDFPLQNPYQGADGVPMSTDAYVAKLAPSGSSLIYSTYLGGDSREEGHGIAVDSLGAAYVTGWTRSANFPRKDPFQDFLSGYTDAFVTKLVPAGNDLVYSTFLGGTQGEGGEDIAVDALEAVYVIGDTTSTNSLIDNTYQIGPGGDGDIFIAKMFPDGSDLVYWTYLGGSGWDSGTGIDVDTSGAAYMAGETESHDFPLENPLQPSFGGGLYDVFVSKLAPSGNPLLYSTYLGGNDIDAAWRMRLALDPTGAVVVTDVTRSDDFPLENPLQSARAGYEDIFVTKLCPGGCSGSTSGQTAGVREADYNFDTYGAFAQGQVGTDPINTRTGKLTDYEVDLSVPTLAGALSFERSYSSANARDVADGVLDAGMLSPGWNHNYEVRLILPTQTGGKTELYTAGGSRLGFVDNRAGGYVPDAGVGGTLTRSGTGTDTTYVYRSTADIGYTFDDEGVLQSIDPRIRGGRLLLEYDEATGLLTKVYSADSLRALFFDYDLDANPASLDRVRTVMVDANGALVSNLAQSVSFTYSTDGDLETVTDVRGKSWDYAYTDPANLHFLTARYDPNGDLLVGIEYDAQGRAIREVNGAGQTIVELTYEDDGITTIEYGQDGSAVPSAVTHEYDARDTLISQIDGAGGETRTRYAISFRPSSVTDPNGNETTMKWSSDGADLLDVWDAEGSETITTYDDRHNPTLVTNPDGTQTLFVYNGDGTASNPLTGEPVGDPGWDEDVLVLRIDNYVPEPAPAEAGANRVARYEYNGQSLPAKIIRPDGTATCTTYTDTLDPSPAGLPETVKENCTDNPTGLPGENALTSYTYDALGRVETITGPSRRVAGSAELVRPVTKYNYLDDDDLADIVIDNYTLSQPAYGLGVYNLSTRTYRDELGRAYATVTNYFNPFGEDLTADEIDAGLPVGHNLVERVYFDAAGRVETSVQNFVGDLASPIPPGEPAPAQAGDRNLVTRTVYDGAGRVAATIDNYYEADIPGGGVPEPLDLDGEPGAEVTLEISTVETQYNQITRFTYNAAGRVQTTTTAAWPGQAPFYQGTYNLVSASAYDAAGNITASITNYDPSLTDGNGNAFTASIRLSPDEAPVDLIVDPDAPDRNVITCAMYDALNRPEITRAACLPDRTDDYVRPDVLEDDPVYDYLYNLPARAYYDEMGRVYATVANYDLAPGGDLILSSERNFITRTYYDGLGRVKYTVENFAGEPIDPEDDTPPDYDPASPDTNLVTRILYDNRGYPVATIRNLNTPSGDLPTEAEIENTGPDRNLVTVTHYNAIGQADWTVDNFVGNLQALPDEAPAYNPTFPDRNLVSSYVYDELGRRIEMSATRDTKTHDAHAGYDLLGRTIETVLNYQNGVYDPAAPDSDLITSTAYAGLGRVVTTTGPTGQSQRALADALGRITMAVTDPGGLALTTTTAYDAAGRPVRSVVENEVTGDEGDLSTDQVTEVRYDALGRAIETTADPDGPAPISTSASYDLMGRTLTTVDPMGIVTRNFYDSLGRLRKVIQNFTGGAPACSQQPNVATDANICTTYTYDDAGNLVSTTLGNGSTTEYQYDALGRVRFEIIDPDGEAITTHYSYDGAGNQTLLVRAPGDIDNQQVTQYVFDRVGRMTDIHYADPALDVTYGYDAWGNRATMDDAVGTWSYEYDDVNRLVSVTSPIPGSPDSVEVGYAYDGAGQRTGLDLPGDAADVTYSYDLAGRLYSMTDPFAGNAIISYGYDGASRLQTVSRSDPERVVAAYDYDRLGRLKQVLNGPEAAPHSKFDYPTYDARGNRVAVTEALNGGGIGPLQSNGAIALAQPSAFESQISQQSAIGPRPLALNPLLSVLNPRPSTLGPAVQSSITQSHNHSTNQSSIDELLTELDTAWMAGHICAKDAYRSLRMRLENASKSMEKSDSDAAVIQLGAFIDETSVQAGTCIEQATADALITQAQAAIEWIQNPATAAPTPSETPTPDETPMVTPMETPTPAGTSTPSPTASQTPMPTLAPITETSTPTPGGRPPRSDDPVFDAIDLPHDPARGPIIQNGKLALQQDTYQSILGPDGIAFTALVDGQPVGGQAIFLLAAIQQGANPITLPAPDRLRGNADAAAGWQAQDNIGLWQRRAGLYEIAALQGEGVELAYLLLAALPGAAQGDDLTLVVAIDSALEPHQGGEGLLLAGENGSGIRIGAATAVDADGNRTAVGMAFDADGSLRMTVPGEWLGQAAYPILIDPLLASWRAAEAEPAMAYNVTNNQALVAYSTSDPLTRTGAIHARLVDASTGAPINDVVLDMGDIYTTSGAALSVVLHQGPGGPEYLVAYRWVIGVRVARVDAASGNLIGTPIQVVNDLVSPAVDLAPATRTGESLLVWTTALTSEMKALRLNNMGTPSGGSIRLGVGWAPAVTFDQTLDAYVVAWSGTNGEIVAATVSRGGSVVSAFTVSSDPGPEREPDVAYNPPARQTLFVWASQESTGQSIHGRWMENGALGSDVRMSSGYENRSPSVAADRTRSGWVVAWQGGAQADIWLAAVPKGASRGLSGSPVSQSPYSETVPAAAARVDGATLVAFREQTKTSYELKLFTYTETINTSLTGRRYEYDDLGRLEAACLSRDGVICQGDNWLYAYDGAGNPTHFERWDAATGWAEMVGYVYNGANQIACIDDDHSGDCNGLELWAYDPYGNLLNDGSMQYSYEAAGRLSSVTANGSTTTYRYNGDGARVSQTINNVTTTTYTLDVNLSLTQVLSETTNGQTTRYLHGHDLLAQSDGTRTVYTAYDGLGSVRQLIDGSGTVLTSQTFDPYGAPYSAYGSADSSFGWTGEQVDENGLLYLRARYYNPSMGRFMQVDPSRLERNGYQYAGSSPTMYSDPSGNCASPFTFLNTGLQVAGTTPTANPVGPALLATLQECVGNMVRIQNAPKSEFLNALWWVTVGPTVRDVAVMLAEPVFAGQRMNPRVARFGQGILQGETAEQALVAAVPSEDAIQFSLDLYSLSSAGLTVGLPVAEGWMAVRPGVVGNRVGLFGLGGEPSVLGEPYIWQNEGLRIIEDVRYSAATGPSGKRGVISLKGVDTPQITKGPVAGDIRLDDIPEGAYFEIAFGEGNGLPGFARQFGNSPPVYYWREWPEWLIRDKNGDIIMIAKKGSAVEGAKVGMNNYLNKVATMYPDARIRFNLEALTVERGYTMAELRYILGKPALRKITVFYRGSSVLSQDELIPILKHLGVNQ